MEGPRSKVQRERKKRTEKKECQITHTNPFFYTTQNIHFPSLKAAKIEPPPPGHLSNDHEKGAESQQAERAKGENSAGSRQ